MTKSKTHESFYRKKTFLWITSGVFGLLLLIVLAFRVSPWPGALVIRTVFNRGGHKTLLAMQEALPDYQVSVVSNQRYRQNDKDALLDVYIPHTAQVASARLPIVIWTHGGAWLSGDKTDDGPYFERLASNGYVVISLNYSLAPGKHYPTAVHQINDAYAYVQANAARFYADPNKVVLAGDSAGAQLSSQMAALITSPSYAKEVGVQPTLRPAQLAGVVLYCGIYKMEGLATPNPALPKIVGWGDDVSVWAYAGTRDRHSPLIRQMSAYYHVTKNFPATFISGGNGDPLTHDQSIPFAQKLSAQAVPVTTEFFPTDHSPSLPHEYQFTFNPDGEASFAAMTQFLRARLKG
jgi:acetyl esterase/lipase